MKRKWVMKNMKLAVLIPVKNCASTIVRALDSVVNQTYFKDLKNDFVIYLIDDNSTDGLYELVKDYKNLIYIKNKFSGLSSALNTGLFKIIPDDSIKYIARLDGDDEWFLNKIELQMEYLEKNPETHICGTGIIINGKTIYYEGTYPQDNASIHHYLKNLNVNPICHASVIMDKNIFFYCGMYNDINLRAEDFDLWKRCAHFNCIFYNVPLVLMAVKGKELDFKNLGFDHW